MTTNFDFYVEQFSDSKAVCQSIRDCLVVTILFCSHAISLLNRHSFFAPPSEQLETSLDDYIQRLRTLVKRVTKNVNDEDLRRRYTKSSWMPSTSGFTSMSRAENPDFSGREDVIRFMNDRTPSTISSNQGSTRRGGVLLYGLGGVGKTEIACHYVYLHKDEFNWIFWFAADTEEKLRTEVAHNLSMLLQLPADKTQANAALFFQNWLRENTRWLIVFDNVESQALLAAYWPTMMNGVVIVTSRNPDVGDRLVQAESMRKLEKMSLAEGTGLLKSILAMKDDSSSAEETNAARSLSDLADGLPLVLVAVAGFVRQHQSSLTEAFAVFQSSKDLLQLKDPVDTDESVLRKVWAMSLSKLRPASSQLLDILAFFDPDSVAENLVLGVSGSSVNGTLSAAVDRDFLASFGGLRLYSFVHRHNGVLSVHRLVQEAVLDAMTIEKRTRTFQAVTRYIHASFPRQSEQGALMSGSWDACEAYYLHIVSLEQKFRLHPVQLPQPIEFAELLYHCSWYLYERGFFARALQLARTCKEICEKSTQESRLLLANSWTTIGGAAIEQCDNELGYNSLKEALRLRESAVADGLMDASHPQIANSYMRVAAAAVGFGRVEEAQRLNKTSIEIRSRDPSSQLQMLAMSYHNLGISYLAAGQPEEARKALERSQEIVHGSEGKFEDNHVIAMETRIFYCMGNIWLALGDVEKARIEHQRALTIRMRYFGNSHHLTACSQYKLGCIAEYAQDFAKASQYYRESVQKLRHVKSEFGILLVRSLITTGMLQLKQGLTDQGDASMKEAQEVFRARMGRDLPLDDALSFINSLINPFMK
ncbi:hypothetical protein ASPCAL04199 [Aspergillus calidoustus]|uniref:Uncharacterized protein n=1 Tax=Aspergillus calidoustus TaxID=454130 RepID=A0A0U5FU22_ASPCI|nr:hypothetical protein ASPCAL04199 [Aspergillus calidoustus]